MTSRPRNRRRNRTPAVWQPGSGAPSGDLPPLEHSGGGRVFVSWRFFSALIVLGMGLVLALFFISDAFYVHSIAVGGLEYMTKEEVFRLTGVANMHIFWIDPEEVREALLQSPSIADARVTITWPPQSLQVVISERQPALVWVQAGQLYWVDLQGRIMPSRAERPDLIHIVTEDAEIGGGLDANQRIPQGVVNGALQLYELLPDLTHLRYHPIKGLGIRDDAGSNVWFGEGTDMPEKLLIYRAIAQNMAARGIQPFEINIVDPDAPYVCLPVTGCL